MLEIIDYNQKELLPNAKFWELVQNKMPNAQCFKGISFVSSVNFIESNLLTRFPKVTLILGLSDNGKNSIGERMDELFERRSQIVNYSWENPNSLFTKKILDGSLKLFFTKKNLIHAKSYIITNEQEQYLAFNGSMNLTNTAINKNFEQLAMDYGSTSDALYQVHQQLFNDCLENSAVYLDSKKLSGFLKEKDVTQLNININQDSTDMIANVDKDDKNIVVLNADDVKEYKDKFNEKDQLDKLSSQEKLAVAQTITIFGNEGWKKRKTNHIGSSIYQLVQKINYVDTKQPTKNKTFNEVSDYYPKPILSYDAQSRQLFKAPKVGENIKASVVESNLTDEELQKELRLFVDIINEYDTYKDVGEGWQACDYLLFLYESPWLWKIRNIYTNDKQSSSRREDVPLGVALIGRGRTGKSQLGQTLASKLIGVQNRLEKSNFDDRSFALGGKNISKNITNVLTDYMYNGQLVSPMIIDDVDANLTTRTYFDSFIKDVTNNQNLTKPTPTFVFTMNREDDKQLFSLETHVMRRIYYLGFESTFKYSKEKNDAELDSLLNRANDRLFKFCQIKLAEFFADIDDDTVKQVENDYLYPIKEILKKYLEKFDMYDQVADYFKENYDYSIFVGRNDWRMLINQMKLGEDLVFTGGKDNLHAQINKDVFKRMSSNTSRDNGTDMMLRYYKYLPRSFHISNNYTATGFIINVDNFDKWLKSDELRRLYNLTDEAKDQQHRDDQKALTNAISELAKSNEKSQQFMEQMMKEKEEKPKKHGIFGWLHRNKKDDKDS